MKIKHILLVEDDMIAQRIEYDILQQFAEEVDIADTGQAALLLAAKKPYSHIFIDISLPDMDGFTLAETLRQQPNHQQATLIALSVHADALHRQCAQDSGMTQFIRKPLTREICAELFNLSEKKRTAEAS